MGEFEDVGLVLPTFPAYVEIYRRAAREWRAKGPRDPIAAPANSGRACTSAGSDGRNCRGSG